MTSSTNIAKELFTRYTNVTTKLNWKLFTKVIGTKRSIHRESNEEKRKCFNLERMD